MTTFARISIGLSLSALVMACSSSPATTNNTTTDGGATTVDSGHGGTDSGTTSDAAAPGNDSGSTGTDAGPACPPVALPGSGVPTYTAPNVAQGVCQTADITAFTTACGGANATSTCPTWISGASATTACGMCLLNQATTVAPVEVLTIGNKKGLAASVGACILGAAGSGASGCAAAVDEFAYCANYVCSACTDATTGQACGQAAQSGDCATSFNGALSACASYQTALSACAKSANTSIGATATAICGSGAASPDAGSTDAGSTDAGTFQDAASAG